MTDHDVTPRSAEPIPAPPVAATHHHPPARVVRSNGAPPIDPTDSLHFPETSLRVSHWLDPVLDHLGHDPRSTYVETYWLPILGPSSTWLARRFADELEQHPDGFDLDPTAWARALGIGGRGGAHSPFWRALERCHRFGVLRRTADHVVVRRRLPPLTAHQADRLPTELRRRHVAWQQAQLETNRRRRLAVAPGHPAAPDPVATGVPPAA